MDQDILLRYVDDIFGYCIKRLKNIEDAKDLSQEILFEIMKSTSKVQIENSDAWIWKIAHNRYARFLNKAKFQTISIDDSRIVDVLTEVDFFEEDNSCERKAAFLALHSIVQSHRDILIDYYISELSHSQIAQKYHLPIGTVKTRLFYGKRKLKERWQTKMDETKIYKKIKWFVCGNGNVDTSYLQRQSARAITTACYQTALSIDEISLATGLPCMYIEDELPMLLLGETLVENKGKYRTNFIIHSERLTKQIESILKEHSTDITEKTVCLLEEYDSEIKKIGFLGSNKPNGELWWFLIPIVLREACEEARRLNGRVERIPFPPRLDGGEGWLFVNVSDNERHEYFSGCNGYYKKNSIFNYFWSSKYFHEEINRYLHRLETILPQAEIDSFDEATIAEGIRLNLIKKDKTGYQWKIAAFNKEQFMELDRLKKEIAKPLAKDMKGIVDKIYSLMQAEIPKHLHDQIKGVFGAELNSIIAMVCEQLETKDILEGPNDDYFTSQIILTMK